MFPIPGYQIRTQIYEGVNSVIYRGCREQDGRPVVLKILKEDYPSPETIAWFKREYEVTRNLNLPGTIEVYALLNHQHSWIMVLEDFGGDSLAQLELAGHFEIVVFLELAIAIAECLGQLHSAQIIHKDINPANIILNPTTRQVKIIDFGISAILSRENPAFHSPNVIEGTLAYLSPEQTGRMNRAIDYRTDFYSLGITFYELLTGRLPFLSHDVLEIVHSHIAKKPLSPYQINQRISEQKNPTRKQEIFQPLNCPEIISDIVMKLMAKNAEDRYQSAAGLREDLVLCWEQLRKNNSIISFPIAQKDFSDRFQIPQKLYGRDVEIKILLDAFNRTSQGLVGMVLITGYSGVGKSALVNEIHKPITTKRGNFIAGKFDQYQRDIPYHALTQALNDFCNHVLTEDETVLKEWKQSILDAVGRNGQVLIDIIPALEHIIGKQPAVASLGPKETQNRFNLVFQNFIKAISQPESPLVLFIDDLQWADTASLILLKSIVINLSNQPLLILGAYRDNEVSDTHPLIMAIEDIKNNSDILSFIKLINLEKTDVNLLISDALSLPEHCSQQLTDLVYSKTQGNVFFTTEFLKTLYTENLLSFNHKTHQWQWDVVQIQAKNITDNVVELMAGKIDKLRENVQTVLQLAACIGSIFDLATLTAIYQQTLSTTISNLFPALEQGLVVPIDNVYKLVDIPSLENTAAREIKFKFQHDQVQQAAYSGIEENQKQAIHLKAGRLLLKSTEENELELNIFDIVNQFNESLGLLEDNIEKIEIAKLNLIAGRKAKAATAYESAIKYFDVVLSLLGERAWETEYDLMLNLHVEQVETQYLNTNFEKAETIANIVLKQAKTILEKVKVYETKIEFYTAQNHMREAVELGLQFVEMLDVTLAETPPQDLLIDDLYHLPIMTDDRQLAAMKILMATASPAYLGNPEILPTIIFTMIDLCKQGGNSSPAAFAYAAYGLLLCGFMGDIELGYRFGNLALWILEQLDAREIECRVNYLFDSLIRHWKEPARNAVESLRADIQIGLETGDIAYVCFAAIDYNSNVFLIGDPLESVKQEQKKYIGLIQILKQQFSLYYAKIWGQLSLTLTNSSPGNNQLNGELFDEVSMVPILEAANNFTALFSVYLVSLILSYLFRDYETAANHVSQLEKYEHVVIGLLVSAQSYFYASLTLLALYSIADSQKQEAYLGKVAVNQQKLRSWADCAPMNFQHKYELVEAEKARLSNQNWNAMELYEKAIQGARENGYLQDEAIAYELAAEFYLSRDKIEIAKLYFTKACYGYVCWQATAKVQDLEERYPQFFSQKSSGSSGRTTTFSTTSTDSSTALDLASVLKVSQALSSEILLETLLAKIMTIVTENAGAQKSLLILAEDGKLLVEAESIVGDGVEISQPSTSIEKYQNLPKTVVYYVERSLQDLVLEDAAISGDFTKDPYIVCHNVRSVLCIPVMNQGKLFAILYLENNLISGAFTPDRIEVLKLLSSQATISLKNALLYASLEQKVLERTQEIDRKNIHLEQTLQELKYTQTQLIQSEKMSGLGHMVAGISHEINNPISFIYGNLHYADEYIQDLLSLIEAYQKEYPDAPPSIQDIIAEIDLDFLETDLKNLIASMGKGAERIRRIVMSLRNFSRIDESEQKAVDIHAGIDNTLLLLQHRLEQEPSSPNIKVIKEYGQLPGVTCYAGQLNQVFMNILGNAIDALEMVESPASNPTIWIRTAITDTDTVTISISDNGPGIAEAIKSQIFDPFFTTKSVGSGTGLGLSMSYYIVVDKHKGRLICNSLPGGGAEFAIALPLHRD